MAISQDVFVELIRKFAHWINVLIGVISDFVAIEFNSVKAKVGKISREIRLFALMKLEKDAKGTIPVEKIRSVPVAALGKTTPLIVPFVPEYRIDDVKNVLM